MRARAPLDGLAVLERGWLSSNNLLVHAAPGEPGAVLIDASHLNHAEQTVALVAHALQGRPLARLINTHLHSDHCGGNAALARAFGVPVAVPPGQAEAVRAWRDGADGGTSLNFAATGQRLERFEVAGTVAPGEVFVAGGREWQVIAAPGHDPHSVVFFDATHGVLASADALWEHGFGVVFPELEGEPGFDDVAAVLDAIAALPVKLVVPGHGAPFADVAGALARARARLAGLRADPARHAKHALKVLLKYHLMEEGRQPLPALLAWAVATPLVAALWQRFAPRGVARAQDWILATLDELVQGGALRREGELLFDR